VGECCHFAGGEGRHFLLLFFKETGRQKGICKRRLLPYIRCISISQAPFFAFILLHHTNTLILFISRDAGSELHGLKKYGKHRADEIIIGL
jgi:hypothetical protein